MSDKRKNKKFADKRKQRNLNRLTQEGWLVNGVEIPRGAILADQSKVVPNNSHTPPPVYYLDIEFCCRDCGREDVWSAKQQKWYYEEAKGSLFQTAVRCRDCRNMLKDQKELQRQQMDEAKRRESKSDGGD